jgi:hypothetical protein
VTLGRKMSQVDEGSLNVVARSAVLLLHHGSPYLPADQISRVFDYNPYEPAMAIFGLPAAAGLPGAAGNPRLWMGLCAAAIFAAAFRLATPGRALRSTAFAFGSPVLALPLTTGLTDLPVLALLSLTLAGTLAYPQCRRPVQCQPVLGRRAQLAAAIALGAACAIKATAWPALPVIAAMLAARDGGRAATRFAVTAILTALALVAATAPACVSAPAALWPNTVLFPLGLTRYQTRADSPLPGHLLAITGPAGHWAAIGLLGAFSVAIWVSLVVRPPADTQAAAWRLAVNLATLFALAPASRWGYFVYPAALLGFVSLARKSLGAARPPHPPEAEPALAWRLADLQDEEQEAQETASRSRVVVGEELAGSIRRGRGLADGRYPEACGGEGVGHRVQRPVPETHQRGLAARGPLSGQVGGREIVGLVARLAAHEGNGQGMVDGHDEPSAGLEHAPKLGERCPPVL